MNYLKNTLEFALSLKRPYKGKSVDLFKQYLIDTLPDAFLDGAGNVHCTIGASPRTLFSAHTDTVHRDDGKNDYVISEEHVVSDGKAFPKRTMYRATGGAVLGADDAAGCALLVHMAMNGVSGHYVFHHGEEAGGIGSGALENAGVFKNTFDRAIAFDRKATHSIITSQSRGNCCSLLFAKALSDALNDADESFMFTDDDTGSFTDTANYMDQILECTNVSCGYYSEHSSNESLDYTFLEALSKALLKVDWESLPIGVREPEPVYTIPKYATFSNRSFHDDYPTSSAAIDLFPSTTDYYAEDLLYDLMDMFPEVFDKITYKQIEDCAECLGEDGVIELLSDVEGGEMDENRLIHSICCPMIYKAILEERGVYENHTYRSSQSNYQ